MRCDLGIIHEIERKGVCLRCDHRLTYLIKDGKNMTTASVCTHAACALYTDVSKLETWTPRPQSPP